MTAMPANIKLHDHDEFAFDHGMASSIFNTQHFKFARGGEHL
jgi:predicted N-acyltransferase